MRLRNAIARIRPSVSLFESEEDSLARYHAAISRSRIDVISGAPLDRAQL